MKFREPEVHGFKSYADLAAIDIVFEHVKEAACGGWSGQHQDTWQLCSLSPC